MPQSTESGCVPISLVLYAVLARRGSRHLPGSAAATAFRGAEPGSLGYRGRPRAGYARLRGGGTTRSRGSRATGSGASRAPQRPRSLVSARITPLRLEAFEQLPKHARRCTFWEVDPATLGNEDHLADPEFGVPNAAHGLEPPSPQRMATRLHSVAVAPGSIRRRQGCGCNASLA